MTVKTITPKTTLPKPQDQAPPKNGTAIKIESDPMQAEIIGEHTDYTKDTPSFLDAILASQATLTEEDKNEIHLALQG